VGANNESRTEAKTDPSFENKRLKIKYPQRETLKTKGFNGLKGKFFNILSISKNQSLIDHGCQPSSQKEKRKVKQKEVDLN
jgi:hypothetical protein